MQNQKLYKAVSVLAILVLLVVILVFAKSFLVPIAFAGLLSMLWCPVQGGFNQKALTGLLPQCFPF
jgi:predicted PurR-regulated permease PerM